MNSGRLLAGLLALPVLLSVTLAQAPPLLPVLDDKPTPQVDARGPSATVTALAFSEDGETLYAAGLDKVVRVWTLQKGRFVLTRAYRVPIGPDNAGAVNAVALSPDGAWLAMAGNAPRRGDAGFRQSGIIVKSSALGLERDRDLGMIYVASTANPAGGKVLRDHPGEVRALAFAPSWKDKAPVLVSAATEYDGDRDVGGLRLWDVAAGKPFTDTPLAKYTGLPVEKDARPGLAIWHTGPGAKQIRVAVAWREKNPEHSYIRLWDPSTDAPPGQVKADTRTRTAVLLSQGPEPSVLTGGLGPDGEGRLGAWQFNSERPGEVSYSTPVVFPRDAGSPVWPVSLAVLRSPGERSPRHAAVVLLPRGVENYRLALVDLRDGVIPAKVLLARSDRSQLPVVATGGRYIAVAATTDHAIQVYRVSDLLAGKTEPMAVLRSDGLAPVRVAFIDRGRGLWLSTQQGATPLEGGLLFDLEKRSLRANDRAGLSTDITEKGRWTLTVGADSKSVTVREGDREVSTFRLRGERKILTKVRLRPPAPGRPGVLAVAYMEGEANRPVLLLCDPATGKPYRQLTGHLQEVRDLAFSATRPLLASVADDQTVCVWSLADLDSAVGQVSGLSVDEEKGKVVVRAVEAGSPAAGRLAKGDVLEQVGAIRIRSAADFLGAVSARQPGEQVEVRVTGRVVKLPIERGVDERKPLFSLFLLRRDKLPGWIGWSPAGPYDASDPAAEAHLGWHTNTGDPTAPVSYVKVDRYRKEYQREDILRYLAAEADLARALERWKKDHPDPLPPPRKAALVPPLWWQGAGRPDTYLVRQGVSAVRAMSLPAEEGDSVRWRITRTDGGIVGKENARELSGTARPEGKEWEIDLTGVEWRRGEYRLRVALHAGEREPELPDSAQTVTLRFRPPAPVISLRLAGETVVTTEEKPLEVKEDRLAAKIFLEVPAGQEVEVQFAQALNGSSLKEAPAPRPRTGKAEFPQEFKLQEGLNRLTVRAINKGADSSDPTEQAVPQILWVRYKVPHELPPRITGLRLDPDPEVKHQDGKEVWEVSRPAVRLTGKIESEGVLVQAAWSAGGPEKSVLRPGDVRTAEIRADLEDLKPGKQVQVRLWAKSKNSEVSTAEYQIVYRPPLPSATLDPLAGPEVVTDKVLLTGKVQAATDSCTLGLRVTPSDGKARLVEAEVDHKAGRWKAELTLFPGINTIEMLGGNPWREKRLLEGEWKLLYRRPARITAWRKEVEAVETNKVKLQLTVESPADRPLTGIKVEKKAVRFTVGEPDTRGPRPVWPVELPEVFVNDGDRNLDQIAVQAVTAEGESEAVLVRVKHIKVPRLPVAHFIRPRAPDETRRPTYTVAFRVESERPLERVEVRRGEETLCRADLKKVEREGKRFILEEEAQVALTRGLNVLDLVAVNSDGRSRPAQVVVSYIPPGALILIDGIELRSDKNEFQQLLKASHGKNGEVICPVAPRSVVWLVGRVHWSDPKARALTERNLEVEVKVGDCRQFPAPLGLRGAGVEPNERRFSVPLVLISKENRIKIQVPTVGQQEGSSEEFELGCAKPEARQRLHLLIVGVEVKDAAGLKERVLNALAADPRGRPTGNWGGFTKKPPFEKCILYHVLTGEVRREKVLTQLSAIAREIKTLQDQDHWLNDVVLIYYQGQDAVVPERKERWLKTSINVNWPDLPLEKYAIGCHELPRIPGALLLLLNVPDVPKTGVVEAGWGGDADIGFLRYACSDPAEVRKANPGLLSLLEDAFRKKDLLGNVVNHISTLLAGDPKKFTAEVRLDEDQRRRRMSKSD
jgi:WD40 repeat protein